MGIYKDPNSESRDGVVAEALARLDEKVKPRVEIIGELHEGLVSISEKGVVARFERKWPDLQRS